MNIVHNLVKRIYAGNFKGLQITAFGIFYLIWRYFGFSWGVIAPNIIKMHSTLGASWILGLNWASLLNLKWSGDNLVFTYGPLYFLDGLLIPEFHSVSITVLTNVGMKIFYAACFSYIYSFFVGLHFKSYSKWIPIIVVLILLAWAPQVNLIPMFVAFIFLPVIFLEDNTGLHANRIERYTRYGIATLLLAVIPFIKFSHIYESFLFIIVFMVFLVYSHRFLDATLIGIMFFAFTILVWVLAAKETVFALVPYWMSRLNMASGYTEAMMLDFSIPQYLLMFVLALLFFGALTSPLVYFFLTKRTRWATAWLLPMITLFLGFKSAFVRADQHAEFFLSYIPLSALYYFYLIKYLGENERGTSNMRWRRLLARTHVPILAIIVLGSFAFSGMKTFIGNQFMDVAGGLASSANSLAKDRVFLRKTYNLQPEFIGRLDPKATIDIIPWDIALLYAYDLQWKPRPVLQSYASYTPNLDDLDALFFQKPDSPSHLIFSLFAIDNRYALFDTPHTFRVLLDNYRFITRTQDERYALLVKRRDSLSRSFVLINHATYRLNESIPIPKEQNAHVFMVVDIQPTVAGSTVSVVYKPTQLFVEMQLKNGQRPQYRYIRNTGINGLFVSKYVQSLDDLQSVFAESYEQDITSVRILGNSWFYGKQFNVYFYKIPFKN